jgi:riboflavin biosynthesis pyrimidine reductase
VRGYGGTLGFPSQCLFANFVASVDGVVSMHQADRSPGSTIGGNSPADRFVMGLLRACAEAVLVGAGTLRAAPGHRWTPEYVYPDGEAAFTELRLRLGLARHPRLVVVTARGEVDPSHPALEHDSLVLTNEAGASRLRRFLPKVVSLVALGRREELEGRRMLDAIHAEGHRVVLTEGGPHLLGSLLRAAVLDELFLTMSPRIVGRGPSQPRLALVEGVKLPPGLSIPARLLSLRRHHSYLFLRYGIGQEAKA